ncbi:MAG: hypothetical protein ACNA8W_01185 [Bradymonadaceae bacterium]
MRNSATLTIEADTTVLFELGKSLRIGEQSNPGFITVMGEPDGPVYFGGTDAVEGWWRGVFIGNSNTPYNVINHLTIAHGGSNDWGTFPAANLHMTSNWGATRIRLNGVHLQDGYQAGLFLSASNVNIDECQDFTFSGFAQEDEVIGNVDLFESACGTE